MLESDISIIQKRLNLISRSNKIEGKLKLNIIQKGSMFYRILKINKIRKINLIMIIFYIQILFYKLIVSIMINVYKF